MTKNALLAGGAILAVALAPVGASAKPKPKPPTRYCVPKRIGFHARGTLISADITQTQGADTAKRRDDRYSGEITVDVKRANHRAPKGEQTYTLANARVRFHPHGHTDPAAGDRVHVRGRLTRVRGKHCTNKGVIAQTVRKADIKAKRSKHS
jgi:hypothetical protein